MVPHSKGGDFVTLNPLSLIDAALANASSWEGAVCRPMKVGKEEIMGMLAAVDYWSHADLAAIGKESQNRLARIAKLVETVPGVTTSTMIRHTDTMYPVLIVKWDESQFGLTVDQCAQQMRKGDPRFEVWTNSNPGGVKYEKPPETPHPEVFRIDTMTLQPGEDLIVGNRLRQKLDEHANNLRERVLKLAVKYRF